MNTANLTPNTATMLSPVSARGPRARKVSRNHGPFGMIVVFLCSLG